MIEFFSDDRRFRAVVSQGATGIEVASPRIVQASTLASPKDHQAHSRIDQR
jgi:hypothetical protein